MCQELKKKYYNERTLNPYYLYKSPKPRILAAFIVGICGAWIFFYSVQMNFVIGNDCYAAQNNSTGVWFSHSGTISSNDG